MICRIVLFALSLLVMLCKPIASQSPGPWSAWTCTSSTEASRHRSVANCTTMEATSCINSTDMQTRTDVVSISLGFSQWTPMVPSCGTTTRMFTQSRSTQCLMVDIQCSDVCNRRTSVRATDIPLCCTALPWNQWTAWSSTTCLSVDTLRTRQRSRNRASCVNVGDCEDNCDSEIENKTIIPTTWNAWGTWSPVDEQMCSSGQRSRQRTCPNDPLIYCELECSYGDSQSETDCCQVQNQWSAWNSWSDPSSTGCPAIRTRSRTCSIDNDVGMAPDVTRTYPCSGSCTLTSTDSEQQMIFPERCATNYTGTSSGGGSMTGAAVGGAIGGVLLIVVIFAITIIVILVIMQFKKKSSYPVYELPIASSQDNVKPAEYETVRLENIQYGYSDSKASSRDKDDNDVVMMLNPSYEVNTSIDDNTSHTQLVIARDEEDDEDDEDNYEFMQYTSQ